jgi:hypothetical protein
MSNERDTGTLFPDLPPDEAASVFYDIVDEHACNLGADSVLYIVRDWFANKALEYAPGTAHRATYVSVSESLEDARESVTHAGAERVECSPLPQIDLGRQMGDETGTNVEYGDGT